MAQMKTEDVASGLQTTYSRDGKRFSKFKLEQSRIYLMVSVSKLPTFENLIFKKAKIEELSKRLL